MSTQIVSLVCPHCATALPAAWSPDHTGRCPTCRLVIGAGRATAAGLGAGGGSVASLLVNAARRSDVAPGDPDDVIAALITAADLLDTPVGRLRMLDYRRLQATDETLVGLGVVIATFGSWKDARWRARQAQDA